METTNRQILEQNQATKRKGMWNPVEFDRLFARPSDGRNGA
jgi:hypothetical protein